MKKILPIILIFVAMTLTGCMGMEMPALTEDEEAMVAQAIAYRLLQRDDTYKEKLVTPTVTPKVTPTNSPTPIPTATVTPTPEALPTQGERPDTPTPTPIKNNNNDIPLAELSEVIGIEGVTLEYGGYELFDNYTYGSYSLEADSGKALMIVKIIVKNNLSTHVGYKMNSKDFSYRLDVNTGTTFKPKITWLLNDFSTLNITIAANDRFEAVLVFDVPKDFAPDTMNLFITKDKKAVIVKLK